MSLFKFFKKKKKEVKNEKIKLLLLTIRNFFQINDKIIPFNPYKESQEQMTNRMISYSERYLQYKFLRQICDVMFENDNQKRTDFIIYYFSISNITQSQIYEMEKNFLEEREIVFRNIKKQN